ncbi:MAG TPA: Fe-S cluster assembly protein IscX [Chitinophagaceae bacterium]|nr:Fe-S cluster assembly protein IscX [Chitinophagaceae bacterium]
MSEVRSLNLTSGIILQTSFFMTHFEPPIHWNDHEDIAQKLYERFGDDFNEGKIYRVRFTDLLEWVLQIPNFEGKREESNEGHLEMIQSAWVYEWRDNQK